MKGNRLIKIIKKYQRVYGEDPEILFRGVFGYSDVEVSSLTDRMEGGRDSRGRAVCVIEGYGQGRTYPTLALDGIERDRATGNPHPDNDAYTLRNTVNVQQSTPRVDFGIPDDIPGFAQATVNSILNNIFASTANENSQENSN